tara:strand:+ start:37165 stop:38214 length:1050 start_codon:yes stop_codon:yes gene_type:complete
MKYKKKIGIIGIRGLPAMYGAFDRFVEQFVGSKNIKQQDVVFYVSCDFNFKEFKFKDSNVIRVFVYRGKGFLILLSYFKSIVKMYLNGVRCFLFFGYGAAPLFLLLKILNCKIVCNPDGIEWRRPEGRIKKMYFRFCEKLISKINIIRIFDSKVIERYYSINHSAKGKTIYYPSIFENYKIEEIKKKNYERFYIIGRLLEENNTEMIVKAFTRLNVNKKLYIIGKSNDYFEKKIRPLILNSKNIIHLGPIYDQNKLYRICKYFNYYVHGHSVGGTNPTLIEAVNLQKPIISFNTLFNREILRENACYFRSDNELHEILKNNTHHKINKPLFKEEYTANYINNAYFELVS